MYIEMKIHPFPSRYLRFPFNLALGLGWWMRLEAHKSFTCGDCTPPRVRIDIVFRYRHFLNVCCTSIRWKQLERNCNANLWFSFMLKFFFFFWNIIFSPQEKREPVILRKPVEGRAETERISGAQWRRGPVLLCSVIALQENFHSQFFKEVIRLKEIESSPTSRQVTSRPMIPFYKLLEFCFPGEADEC